MAVLFAYSFLLLLTFSCSIIELFSRSRTEFDFQSCLMSLLAVFGRKQPESREKQRYNAADFASIQVSVDVSIGERLFT